MKRAAGHSGIAGASEVSAGTAGRARRVLIVDDHPVVREGLHHLLSREPDLEVCGEAASHAEAMRGLPSAQPDLVLVDVSLPKASGLDLVKDLRATGYTMPILVLSMHDETLFAERAIKAGANGYVMKSESSEGLLKAIRTVLGGKMHVSEEVTELMMSQMAHRAPAQNGLGVERLSDREMEVFEMTGQGKTTREIAYLLGVSSKTVEAHRFRIRVKLGIKNASQLVHAATTWLNAQSVLAPKSTAESQGGPVGSGPRLEGEPS